MSDKILENFSKFQDLYKSQTTASSPIISQEERRELLLNEQKQRRSQLQDKLRGIEEFVENLRKRRKSKTFQYYSERNDINYSLQLSEWLKEKPQDLNDWYLVPCPKGKRCLVVSHKGRTEVYNKSGKFIQKLKTMFPGDGVNRTATSVFDCINIEETSTYFILDVLAYNNQQFIDCETEFRFFWITTKLIEEPVESFIPLSFYDFEDEFAISSCLMRYPQWDNESEMKLDGFLFYHKKASYTSGTTPLVGWLFGFMIPDVLDISVNLNYLNDKPEDYVDYLQYITIFDENMTKRFNKYKNRRRRKYIKEEKMDSETSTFDHDDCSNDTSGDVMEVLEAEKLLELEDDRLDKVNGDVSD